VILNIDIYPPVSISRILFLLNRSIHIRATYRRMNATRVFHLWGAT